MTSAFNFMSISSLLSWPFGSYTVAPAGKDDASTAQASFPPPHSRNVSELLQHYDVTCSLPPSSRVDPSQKQQIHQPLGVRHLWRYGLFVASKATEVALEVISHHLWGPRRKSWGIEMTIITSFMRDTTKHSRLADIVTLRKLIELVGYVPVPTDALVTPVTFRARRRRLRGMLAEWDALETGSRELSGEWIVGKKLWQALQSEWKSSQRSNFRSGKSTTSRSSQVSRRPRIVLYLHGGAYYLFNAVTHRLITIQLSKSAGARIFALDYRLSPETRFPGQLLDAVQAYLRLIDDSHVPPENIIIAGDSAGGGLSLGLLMYLRDNGYPMPAGAILLSPWVDLTMSCDSWDSNAAYDIVPMPQSGNHLDPVACYLGEQGMEKYITHPYASPLFGDFQGLPPMLIQAGDSEVLRDEVTLLAHKASLAGVKVQHELYEDAVHVFQTFPFLDASRKAFAAMRDFANEVLPLHKSHSLQEMDNVTERVLEHEIYNEKATVVRADGLEVGSACDLSSDIDEASHFTDPCMGQVEEFEEHSWHRRDASFLGTYPEVDHGTGPAAGNSATDVCAAGRPNNHRFRSTFTRLTLQPADDTPETMVPTPPVSPSQTERFCPAGSGRNHCLAGSSLRLSTLSMSSSTRNPPTPTIRSRNRTISHPDISSLCEQWASQGPANQTTTYVPNTNNSVNPQSVL